MCDQTVLFVFPLLNILFINMHHKFPIKHQFCELQTLQGLKVVYNTAVTNKRSLCMPCR
jgi:hypothetical protein